MGADDLAAPVEVLLHTVNGTPRELEAVWYGEASQRDGQRITPATLSPRA